MNDVNNLLRNRFRSKLKRQKKTYKKEIIRSDKIYQSYTQKKIK